MYGALNPQKYAAFLIVKMKDPFLAINKPHILVTITFVKTRKRLMANVPSEQIYAAHKVKSNLNFK